MATGKQPTVETQRALAVYKNLEDALHQAEVRANDALARYKLFMFGYWSAKWVQLNELGRFNKPNPWQELTAWARTKQRK